MNDSASPCHCWKKIQQMEVMRWVLGVLGFSCEKLASKLKSYGLTDRSLEIANPYGNPPQTGSQGMLGYYYR
jgi:hypothetical protein